MDSNQFALLVGASATVMAAWRVPRAVLWICLMALSFMFSSAYWELHIREQAALQFYPGLQPWWIYPGMFAGICDVGVLLVMQKMAERQWEMRVANVIHAMVFVNLLWQIPGWFHLVFGWLASWFEVSNQFLYGVILDVGNWLALFIIALTAVLQAAGNGNHNGHNPGRHAWYQFMPLRRHLLAHRAARSHAR